MIKKKIKRLQNRSYKIKEALTCINVYTNRPNNEKLWIYEGVDYLYRKRTARNKKSIIKAIQDNLAGNSKYEIESNVIIDLFIFVAKLKNFNQQYSIDTLVKRLTDDVRKSFDIDSTVKEIIYTEKYFTKITFNIKPNYKIIVTLHTGSKSLYTNINKDIIHGAEILIKRNKTITSYF